MRLPTPYRKLKPNDINDLTWRILVEAWENGLSDREVSLRLCKSPKAKQMTSQEIRKLVNSNPDIADLKAMLSLELVTSAKDTVASAVKKGDLKTAKWYLERKAADEFSTKAAVAFESAVIELSIEDKEKALKQMIKGFESDGE